MKQMERSRTTSGRLCPGNWQLRASSRSEERVWAGISFGASHENDAQRQRTFADPSWNTLPGMVHALGAQDPGLCERQSLFS